MKKTLLIADDEKAFQQVIARIFAGTDWEVRTAGDGLNALEQICESPPDLLLLDLNMPRLCGTELLVRIRGNPRLAMLPVIIISGNDSPEEKVIQFGIGADDFISKPFDARELVSRVEGAARRNSRMLGANPLTHLPGGPEIEQEASRRIKAGTGLAFFHIDIDNFKAYNDSYGYLNGDRAIKCVAGLLAGLREKFASENFFVGHIGGDDFVMMADFRRADEIALALADGFDSMAPGLYGEADRARGFIPVRDRSGRTREVPLMTLSIAIATNEKRTLGHYAKMVDITAEIKRYLKGLENRSGSMYIKDRRAD